MEQVTVYSSNRCVYCVMVKNLLKEQNIQFQEVNVDGHPEVVQKLIQSTGRMGVPQTEINGKWVVGYDPNSIMKALEK
ncbi:glutaredoxin family protein [Bacillus sp. JJ722]|uniref:glutaredoxin family protein n=1 Tax=Bacillus sp. JJ722 TaxID=3122973 RepID=UPI002FFD64B0